MWIPIYIKRWCYIQFTATYGYGGLVMILTFERMKE